MDTLTYFPKIVARIIKEQELIIGPLAWDEARKVPGLTIDQIHNSASFSGNEKEVVNSLVAQYERMFGKASHMVCHDAVKDLIAEMSPSDIPESLK